MPQKKYEPGDTAYIGGMRVKIVKALMGRTAYRVRRCAQVNEGRREWVVDRRVLRDKPVTV